MSVPPDPPRAALATEPCASCGAPLAHDQRYCLQCGDVRREAARQLPAQLRTQTRTHETEVVTSAPPGRDRWPSLAEALAGLACLLLAVGVGVVIGRSADDSQPAPAPITVAAGPAAAAATPVATAFTGDWPAGKDGWTVALNVLPKASTQPDAVIAAKTAATGKGAPAVGALDADMYPSLTAGSYVVYSGIFDDAKAAAKGLTPLKSSFPDARVVRVGATGSLPSTATSGGAAKRTPAQKKREAKAGAADTKKEFERSKKVPKTTIIPGKPPPKDNKPPGGGAESEEIE